MFLFPHKVALSQKCSVAVYSTLLCTLSSMIFSSPFPGSPAPRKSQSLFWVSFRVVHNRFNLFRHATTILVKKILSTLLGCWFPLLSLLPPSGTTVYHTQVSFRKMVFVSAHQPAQNPSVVPYHLEWSLPSEPDPQSPFL